MAAAARGSATSNASTPSSCIEAVTIDDMVFFAKNMLDKQQEFIQNNVSGYIGKYIYIGVFKFIFQYAEQHFHKHLFSEIICFIYIMWGADIGYHYTDQRNMDNIRTHGLLTKAERDTNKVTAAPRGRYD